MFNYVLFLDFSYYNLFYHDLVNNIKDSVEIEGRYSFIRTKWTSSTSTARQTNY